MKRELSDKQRAHIEKLKASGHYSRAGKLGGQTKYAKHGTTGMASAGLKGAQKLMERFASPEAMKAYYSEIGSMKKGEGRIARRSQS